MVRRDQVDGAGAKGSPEPFAIFAFADRRRALKFGRAVSDFFCCERQVMWTRFNAHQRACRFSGLQLRNRIGRSQMNNVNARIELAAQPQEQRNRLVFGLAGPGSQPRCIIARRICSHGVLRCCVDGTRQFRVSEQRSAERRQFRQRRAQIGLRDMRKFRDAAGHQEALEAKYARVPQGPELGCVAGHYATPESDIDPQFVRSCAEFLLVRRGRRSRGYAIERHLDQCGDATRSGRLCRAGKAFPLGAAGLVDMDVRIDESRHHDGFAGFVDGPSAGNVIERGNIRDQPMPDANRRAPLASWRNHAVATNDEIRVAWGAGGFVRKRAHRLGAPLGHRPFARLRVNRSACAT